MHITKPDKPLIIAVERQIPPRLARRGSIKARLRGLASGLFCLAVAAIGLALWPFSRRGQDFKPEAVKRILVVRLDLLGDLVLSMPAVQTLRETFPGATISMLVLPYTAPLLDHYPFVAKVFSFDVNRLRPSGQMLSLAAYRDLWSLVRSLRAERYDLAVSLHGIWASMFAFGSGALFRAGYDDESCPFTLNLGIPGKRYRVRRHEADYCLDLALAVAPSSRTGIPAEASSPTTSSFVLSPLPWAQASLDQLLFRLGIGEASLIAIHVGATNGSAKRWTPEGMAVLADRLMKDGATVVFTGSKGDIPAVQEVVGLMIGEPVVLAGLTSVPELIALLARSRLLISGDTGPLHLATALGVPVVAIHGPSDPALSGPYGGRAIVVRKDLPCGPCYDLSAPADCPREDPICMKGITADEVYAAARQQLGEGLERPRVLPQEG